MNSLATDDPRRAIDPELTVGQMCMAALEDMLTEKSDERVVTVLADGGVYFYHVKCVGYKPPYQALDPAAGELNWMGQRQN
jgi:hypothetical protein